MRERMLNIKPSKEIKNYINGTIPDIYYVGLRKTGSASLMYGFPDNRVAHWHGLSHFERLHKTNYLSSNKISLYEYIFEITKYHNIEPLIIESVREPVARRISEVFQDHKFVLNSLTYDKVVNILDNDDFILKPESLKLKKVFNLNLEKVMQYEHLKICIIRNEDTKKRVEFFKELGYDYVDNRTNDSKKKPWRELYNKVIKNYRVDEKKLLEIYGQDNFKRWYSDEEKNKFIEKWVK